MWRVGELVRKNNSTAIVKNYFSSNNFIVLTDINGSFQSGDIITGDDSEMTGTLNNFTISNVYDSNFADESWSNIEDIAITLDSGSYVAIDAHFDGTLSQDYQTRNIVTL